MLRDGVTLAAARTHGFQAPTHGCLTLNRVHTQCILLRSGAALCAVFEHTCTDHAACACGMAPCLETGVHLGCT